MKSVIESESDTDDDEVNGTSHTDDMKKIGLIGDARDFIPPRTKRMQP
jgi:hypothetical protein